ncbi:hypothetical protein M0804_000739 [Polistes exclamans]|nr:hypothetical protein M0804_000739 [Polistes exclamans]
MSHMRRVVPLRKITEDEDNFSQKHEDLSLESLEIVSPVTNMIRDFNKSTISSPEDDPNNLDPSLVVCYWEHLETESSSGHRRTVEHPFLTKRQVVARAELLDQVLTCLFVGWLTGWLVGWLVDWLVGWLVGWLTEHPIDIIDVDVDGCELGQNRWSDVNVVKD